MADGGGVLVRNVYVVRAFDGARRKRADETFASESLARGFAARAALKYVGAVVLRRFFSPDGEPIDGEIVARYGALPERSVSPHATASLRTGRCLLLMSAEEMASATGLHEVTVRLIERSQHRRYNDNRTAIARVLESRGVIFLPGGARLASPVEDPFRRQMAAGRMATGLSQIEISAAAGLTAKGLSKIATGENRPRWKTEAAIRHALEAAGVSFIEQDGKAGPGVTFIKPA